MRSVSASEMTYQQAEAAWKSHLGLCPGCQSGNYCDIGKAMRLRTERALAERREEIRDSLIMRLKKDGYTDKED